MFATLGPVFAMLRIARTFNGLTSFLSMRQRATCGNTGGIFVCFLCLQLYDSVCSVAKGLSNNSQGAGLLLANRVPGAQLETEAAQMLPKKCKNGDAVAFNSVS